MRKLPRRGSLLLANNTSAASACPRYEHCSAAFCPLIGGVHVKGDRTCFWLREAVKPGGRAKIAAACAKNVARAILAHARKLLSQCGSLGDELRRAARHGSQIDAGRRLRAWRGEPLAEVRP